MPGPERTRTPLPPLTTTALPVFRDPPPEAVPEEVVPPEDVPPEVVPPPDGAEPPVTRTMQMARLDPSVTTTLVMPAATGVIVPSLPTVATEGFSLIQV